MSENEDPLYKSFIITDRDHIIKKIALFRPEFLSNRLSYEQLNLLTVSVWFFICMTLYFIYFISLGMDMAFSEYVNNTTLFGCLVFFVGVYWQLDSIYGRNYAFTANIYNRLVDRVSEGTCTNEQYDYIRCIICIDLIDFDLYRHRSYKNFFNRAMEDLFYKKLKPFTTDLDNKQQMVKLSLSELRAITSGHSHKLSQACRRKNT